MRAAPTAVSVIPALMIREAIVVNGRAVGGYAWAILEPVLGIALLTLVFSAISSVPPIGSVYPLFYATGYLPFLFWSQAQARLMGSARSSKALLEHSSVTIPDVLIARILLAGITSAVVMALIYSGIRLIWAPQERIDIPAMAGAFMMTAMLAFGVGTLNAGLSGLFPTWEKIWGIANRPLFMISGVFFPFLMLPDGLRATLWWNPLVHVVGMTREAVYAGYDASYVSPGYVAGFSALTAILGLALLLTADRVRD